MRFALGLLGVAACLLRLSAQQVSDLNEGPDLDSKRLQYFLRPRETPQGFIPAGARFRALAERDKMAAESRKNSKQAQEAASVGPVWQSIGPHPTTRGSYKTAAWTTALAVDPRSSAVVYLGTPEGGVWKSSNGGVNWTPLTDNQPTLAIGSLVLAPSNPDIVYAGTGSSYQYGEGILKSTNAGATWSAVTSAFAGPFNDSSYFGGGARINALAVSPIHPNVIVAAVWRWPNDAAGIFRSTDSGATWTQVFSGVPGTAVLFDPADANVAYAALSDYWGNAMSGVYRSTDSGLTWSAVNGTGGNTLPLVSAGTMTLVAAKPSPGTLYVSIEHSATNNPLGLFRSNDGGANWKQLADLPATYGKGITLAAHPTLPNVIFAGEQELYRSLDGGLQWADIRVGSGGEYLFGDIRAFGFGSDGKFYVGCDGGVWSTPDAAAPSIVWTNLNQDLGIAQFYPGLSIHPVNSEITFGGSQDQGVQRYSGNPAWTAVQDCDGGWTAIDPITPSTIYATCQNNGIYKSTANGDRGTFKPAQTGVDTTDRASFIPPLVMDPSSSARLYFGTYRVYQTLNGAVNWNPISGALTGAADYITTLAVAPGDPSTVYVGTSGGDIQVTHNALTGSGATWIKAGNTALRWITQIAVDPANSSIAYAAVSGFSFSSKFGGHVYKTQNSGVSWTDISSNLPNIPADDIAIDPDLANTLYLATDIGVFRSTDAGASWSPFGNGMPNVVVSSLKIHAPTRTLRAATLGRGMWDLALSSTKPFGVIDTPLDNTFGNGAIGLTGWAIGTGRVTRIGLWREPVGAEATAPNGLVYLADAPIIPGSRPDVASAYPGYPNNNAGWGAQILTNELPKTNGQPGLGTGTYKIHVIATDANGLSADLGTRTITSNNAQSVLPFGTIDTPTQGGKASGANFVNFGWVLTPDPKNVIPKSGATITVYIDNQPVGHPVYNNNRSDIASLFPGLQNSNGAIGYFFVDTTKLSNGLHTISWTVADSAGNAQGIGSRFFNVQN